MRIGQQFSLLRKLMRPTATALLLSLFCATASTGQAVDNVAVCTGQTDAPIESKIAACTSVLDAGSESDPQRLAILYTTRGAYLRSTGHLERAETDQAEAIRLQPDAALLYFNRAITAQARENFDRAIADLDRAIELAPRFLAALRTRADLSYARGDYADAGRIYDKVIDIEPKNARALTMRGLSKWQRGDAVGGREDITAALRLDTPLTVLLVTEAKPRPLATSEKRAELPPDIWHFKGSELALEANGVIRRFRYLRPRPQLQMAGIKSGDLVFDGAAIDDRIAGKVFVFSQKCGARSYDVDGRLFAGTVMTTITLTGRHPTIGNDCRPTGSFETSALEFSRALPPATPPPTVLAPAIPPPFVGAEREPRPKLDTDTQAAAPPKTDDRPRPKVAKAPPKASDDAPRKKTTAEARKNKGDSSDSCADLKSIAATSAVRALLGC